MFREDDTVIQRAIYEEIQNRNVDANFVMAVETTPEAFVPVPMLFVHCTINKVLIKAFVDSGAQISVLSVQAAERCDLIRLVDRRMQGTAVGVGKQHILGRIHLVEVLLGEVQVPFSFSVLDHYVEMIIGLDQLRRHRCMIDLESNCLHLNAVNVVMPFLNENELPELLPGRGERNNGNTRRNAHPVRRATQQLSSGGGRESRPPSAAKTPEQLVEELMGVTGCSKDDAVALLAAGNGNVRSAARLYFAQKGRLAYERRRGGGGRAGK